MSYYLKIAVSPFIAAAFVVFLPVIGFYLVGEALVKLALRPRRTAELAAER